MREEDAILTAQNLADESQKIFVILKCKDSRCQIMQYEYFQKSGKTRYYKKIFPKV
jgi:hypothetical protein